MTQLPSFRIRRVVALGLLAALLTSASGCSLFVMAGKMFFGDPKVKSAFSRQTGVDLTEGEDELLVVCRTPSLMQNQLPSFEIDLTSQVMKQLKLKGVKVTPADRVAHWLDDNAGEIDDPDALAREFKARFLGIVNVREARFREENSEDLLRGYAAGSIRVFEVRDAGGQRMAQEIFTGDFQTEYPRFSPVSSHSVSLRTFQRQFVDHLGLHIARQFHDFRMGDDF